MAHHKLHWLTGSDGDFATAANWDTNTAPTALDMALIDAAGSYTVTSSADATVLSWSTAHDAVFNIVGGTFTALAGTGTGVNAGFTQVFGQTFEVGGTINNTRALTIINPGSELLINKLGATLKGGGFLQLLDSAHLVGKLTNVDNHIILGDGAVVEDGHLTNQKNGIVAATSTGTATINESVTNRGVLEADDGTLALGSSTIDNIGGTVKAYGGTITGGIIVGGAIQDFSLTTSHFSVVDGTAGHTVSIDGTISADLWRGTIDVGNGGGIVGSMTIDHVGVKLTNRFAEVGLSAGDFITGDGLGSCTLTNVEGYIHGAGTIGGGGLALVNQKGAQILGNDSGGSLVIDTGETAISNSGSLGAVGGVGYLASPVHNTSTGLLVAASDGLVLAAAAVTGGRAEVFGQGTIEFAAASSANFLFEDFSFGDTGTLILDDSPHFTGKISGYETTDTIDLTDIDFASATSAYAGSAMGGTLTIADGSHTAKLKFDGNYLTSKFALADDGDGGVVIDVIGQTITGGAGDDLIVGGIGIDTLDGGANGPAGDTISYAYSFNRVSVDLTVQDGTTAQTSRGDAFGDVLTGFENVTGGPQNDVLFGDGGNNTLNGGLGNDEIMGRGGDDVLIGGGGSDFVYYFEAAAGVTVNLGITKAQDTGGDGIDKLSGFENLSGSEHDDLLTGTSGANFIGGDQGDDIIDGGAGTDRLVGGNGGETHGDTVSYASAMAAVTVSLATTKAQNTGGAGVDQLFQFENLAGSKFNDKLTGNDGANVITGALGKDTLTGAAAADHFLYNAAAEGKDTITDFASGTDFVSIVKSGFGIGAAVALGTGDANDFANHYFVSAAAPANTAPAATESGHGQFLFSTTSHQLFWDDDGQDMHLAVLIATLGNGATLQATDFDLR